MVVRRRSALCAAAVALALLTACAPPTQRPSAPLDNGASSAVDPSDAAAGTSDPAAGTPDPAAGASDPAAGAPDPAAVASTPVPVTRGATVAAAVASRYPTVVVPAARAVPVHRDLFAIHQLHSTTTWPAVPVTQLRLWDTQTTWNVLEPSRGRWDFTRLDATVALARKNGSGLLMVLGQTPQWASSKPTARSPYGKGACAAPRSLADWRRYVTTVATRYKGRIAAYETWNEATWPDFWCDSMSRLAVLNREAYTIIKRIDPRAVMVSPSFVPLSGRNAQQMREYFGHKGGRATNVVALHLYGENPEHSVRLAASTRSLLSSLGMGRLPVWNTEITYGRRKFGGLSTAAQVAVTARAMLVAPASGQRRVYLYAWDDWDFGGIQMYTRDRRTTPVVGAYREVHRWMSGASARGCTSKGVVWSCSFDRPGGVRAVAVWTSGGSARVLAPKGYRVVRDLRGRTSRVPANRQLALTATPILLTTR